MKHLNFSTQGLLGAEPEEVSLSNRQAFRRLARSGDEKKGWLSATLELAIIKEESRRAGINYLWHPKYREFAGRPGTQHYGAYEGLYNDPKNKADRDRDAARIYPFDRPVPLKKLLQSHPEMKKYWGHVDPEVQLSEGELVARHKHLLNELGVEEDEDGEWGPFVRPKAGNSERAPRKPAREYAAGSPSDPWSHISVLNIIRTRNSTSLMQIEPSMISTNSNISRSQDFFLLFGESVIIYLK